MLENLGVEALDDDMVFTSEPHHEEGPVPLNRFRPPLSI